MTPENYKDPNEDLENQDTGGELPPDDDEESDA